MNKLPPGGLLSPSCQRYQCVITAFFTTSPRPFVLQSAASFNTGPFQITRGLIHSFTRLNCNCRVPMPTLIIAKMIFTDKKLRSTEFYQCFQCYWPGR